MVQVITLSRMKEKNVNSIDGTFRVDGELIPLRVNEDTDKEKYSEVEAILADTELEIEEKALELFRVMSPEARVREAIKDSYYLSSELEIRDGAIYFGEERLENTLAQHLLSLLDEENTPKDEKLWRSYVRFLDNLHQNANEDIRKQLFRWMDYENKAGNAFAITDDGCLVGYKGCDGTVLEPMSVHSGFAVVDGEEMRGRIPNKVGSVISMPRSAVQYDPSVGCSTGLHVGTRDYATKWAPILLLVKVNPRDVVSVPYECESQKMRVCEYTVLEVTDASDEHKRFYETSYEDYCDEDYCDGDCDCYCDEDGCEDDLDDSVFDDFFGDDEEEDELVMDLEDAYKSLKEGQEGAPFKYIYVEYEKDGKERDFDGEVVNVYDSPGQRPGIIVKGFGEGPYKHIKLDAITYFEYLNEDDFYSEEDGEFFDDEDFDDEEVESEKEVESEEEKDFTEDISTVILELFKKLVQDKKASRQEQLEALKGKRVVLVYKNKSGVLSSALGRVIDIDSEMIEVYDKWESHLIPLNSIITLQYA